MGNAERIAAAFELLDSDAMTANHTKDQLRLIINSMELFIEKPPILAFADLDISLDIFGRDSVSKNSFGSLPFSGRRVVIPLYSAMLVTWTCLTGPRTNRAACLQYPWYP